MKRLTVSLITMFVLLVLSVVNVSAASISRTVQASGASGNFPGIPTGYAYATYTSVPGGTGNVTYGPSIPVSLNCTTSPTSNTLTNSGVITPVNPLVNSGTATSTITVTRSATALSVQTTEDIKNLKLLGGLITANDLQASVNSTSTASGATSKNSSQFGGLTISGVNQPTNPAPNTTLSIPLVGSVTLNEQSGPSNGLHSTSISVIMMDVRVTQSNALGLVVGSRIIVAYAQSAILPSAVIATAYGLYAIDLGGSVPAVGPAAAVGISCSGGSSTNTVNSFNASIIGGTGSETSSVSGHISSTDSNATSHNMVSALNLLSGFASAQSISTTAMADANNTTASSSGSAVFDNGQLDGTALPDNPAPNTRENLPGIGYAILNEQYGSSSATSATITVIGMDIHVTTANNSLNLPAGARILISVVIAAAAR